MDTNKREMTIEEVCEVGRKKIKKIGELIFSVNQNHSYFRGEQSFANQHSEMNANFILAYRHLEDARMRLGKVLQAKNGGVSVYDK